MSNSSENRVTRRRFMQKTTQSAAVIAAMTHPPAVLAAGNSPNEIIGVGHVGIGVRGSQLVTDVAGEPDRGRPGVTGAQIRAICDIYKPHLEIGLKTCGNPHAKAYHNFEDMLQDKNIQAVVISTPDHQHAPMLIAAAGAGKDIYIEKCWTRTIPDAKAMLRAIKNNHTVMQLGHHQRASTAALQARDVVQSGILGEITFIRLGCFRNRARDKAEWRWYGGYNQYVRPNELQVRNDLDWERFLGEAPLRPFSMERFWHWRCYWDYGTGIAGDLLSHAFDFANYVVRLGIPEMVTTSANNNLLRDGREAPDTWNTILEYPLRGLTLLYSSTFNSFNFTVNTDDVEIRGKDALMKVTMDDYGVYPEEVSYKYKDGFEKGTLAADKPMVKFDPAKTPPQPSHMQDFIDCIHTREHPKCNEDEAFVEAVTCIMSVEAYKQQRSVRWDPLNQEIV